MGLLDQQNEGLLPVTSNPKMLAQALKARQTTPRTQLTGQGLLDTAAIGLSPVPVIGDALGLAADANRFYNEPESRTPLNFGLAALGAIPFIPPLVSMGLGKFAQSQGKQLAQMPTGPARNQAGAIVYHGSPHKFDAFDSSKIGTGEGAQAYGHGLYFAENPAVAKDYAEKLAKNATLKTADGTYVNFGAPQQRTTAYAAANRGNGTIEPWAEHLAAHDGNAKKAINSAKKQLAENDATAARMAALGLPDKQADFQRQYWQGIIDNIQSRGKGVEYDRGQHLYKVDLPDEAIAKMLDWDKPLSQQSNASAMLDSLQSSTALPAGFGKALEAARKRPYFDGNDLYMELVKVLPNNQAADVMRQSGFTGVRYLDGGSRGTGAGTSNFVVFPGNEGLLKILERQ